MRETYIPLFQNMLTSSVWATPAETRCVWLALMLSADPEGYVCASVPGLAVAANIPLDKTRQAIELFESPDPDSRSDANEGRRIERVPRGWRIINFMAAADRARHEAAKARKRRWMNDHRRKERGLDLDLVDAEDDDCGRDVEPSGETVDASKSKSKSIPSSEGGDPPTPITVPPVEAQGTPTVWRTLKGWTMSDALRAEALAAGVHPDDIEPRLAELGNGPIGGTRGVLDRDAYVRSQFGKWRTWGETERAKAQQAAQAPPGARFSGGAGVRWEPNGKHKRYAKERGLDLAKHAAEYIRSGEPQERSIKDADRAFGLRLQAAFEAKGGRAA
jgi:hypothetical protein